MTITIMEHRQNNKQALAVTSLLVMATTTSTSQAATLRGLADTTMATETPPDYTTKTTETISGFQPGSGYTYVMDYESLAVPLLSKLLQPVCVGLEQNYGEFGLLGNPATSTVIYDEDFVNDVLSSATCAASCNDDSDAFFLNLMGLENNSDGSTQEYNTKLWGDVVNQTTIDQTLASFGSGFVPATPEQTQCIMNWEQFEEGTDLYYTAQNANFSTYQFAPGLTNSTCEMQLGSTGAYYNSTDNTVNSLCNPNSPGKNWNTYLLNGNYSSLFSYCGYEWPNQATFESNDIATTGNPYYDFMRGNLGCYGMLTGGACQSAMGQSGLNTDACYCITEDQNSGNDLNGLRCPLFGPVFYINLKIVWLLGGVEFMKNMPGSRVPCLQSGMDNSCTALCEQTQITDFDQCKGVYY